MHRLAKLGMIVLLVAVFGGCQRGVHRETCPAHEQCLLYGNGAEPVSLDPAKIDGVWENTIVSQLILGLTQVSADGKLMPGMATSWGVSADGLTWTFHLRDAVWSDGTPVTADDFVYAMQRVVDPKTASYSAFLLNPVKNAEKITHGKGPTSSLGVEAPDPHTFVIHLEHPWLLLPLYAGTRVMWPVPRHVVEKLGDAWTKPGNYVEIGRAHV